MVFQIAIDKGSELMWNPRKGSSQCGKLQPGENFSPPGQSGILYGPELT